MRIHRFYIDNIHMSDLSQTIVTQETSLIHQLKNVFRYNIGQKLYLFNQYIGEIEVEIVDISKKYVSFRYIRHNRHLKDNILNKRQINLYMSVIKNSNFDLIIEKAVELGVNAIVPILTERTIKSNLNIERLNKIIIESSEQSGRLDLLKLNPIEKLGDILLKIENCDHEKEIYLFGSIDNNDVDLIDILNTNQNLSNVSLIIGPEGGFSEDELSDMNSKGVLPFNFSNNVLRAETAAIVGCGIISKLINR